MPAFPPQTYVARRATLARAVGRGLVVLPGHAHAPMNYAGNVYPFRQDGSFLYYAGLDAPGLALTLDAESGEATLFGHDPTMDDVVWEGPLPPLAERAAAAGIRRTAPLAALAEAVAAAQGAGRTVHLLPPYRAETRLALARALGAAPDALPVSEALVAAVVAQRLVKSGEEVAEIERALEIAAAMHRLAMRHAQPGRTEQQVAGAMEGLALAEGSYPSFPIILTRRGEVLHNHPTAAHLETGDLLLADAGAVSPAGRYAADVTRVAPVGGRFSERQRMLYDVVLAAQEAAIEGMRPGVPFRDLHLRAARVIADGLTALGLMRGDPAEAVAEGAHALFFPHGLGHALGLDVHDMEALGEDRVGYDAAHRRAEQFGLRALRFARPLAPGHVVTVEPGVYLIGPLVAQWRAARRHAAFLNYDAIETWVGLGGIRLEDDVLVTEAGARVLGPAIPKAPAAIEAEVQAGADA
ncbi:MAG: aminopeptidase P family protein [Rubricoccaceae bacterium]